MKTKRIYLDYASTTPLHPEVFRAMQPYFKDEFGNPGSLHSFGQAAMKAVDEAREKIARALGADFREVVFTGSATEANNLALRGAVKSWERRDKSGERKKLIPRIVISAIEHESVLQTARDLEKEGVEVIYLPVNKKGIVSLPALRAALTPETILVSVMYGNNETGAVQPIAEIGKILRNFRESAAALNSRAYPLFHTDAAQAFQFLECHPADLGVDLLTLSAHKIYGPKGTAALYVRTESKSRNPAAHHPFLQAVITGGGQEFGLRSGTENAALIAGFGAAVDIAERERDSRRKSAKKIKDRFLKELLRAPGVVIHPGELPHIANFSIPRADAGLLLAALDMEGVAVSAGSACAARTPELSHVLRAMRLPEKEIKSSIRASFGEGLSLADAVSAAKIILRVSKKTGLQ